MSKEPADFVAYIGPPDLHDGRILEVQRDGDRAVVRIQGVEGRLIALEFSGVSEVTDLRAQGMLLYAVAEMQAPAPLKRFVFSNWDETDAAALEVIAREIRVRPQSQGAS